MVEFVGRERELSALRAEFDRKKPSLVVAYGRRRIGKSRLLREAIGERPNAFFQATRVTSTLNLDQFKAEVAKALGPSELLVSLSSWEGVFHYLADAASRQNGLIVVIDEFPYITDGDQALPSILQRFWDSQAPAEGNLKIVLCGSAVAQMEELLAERNPLYGRKTMTLPVKQLGLREAARFFPDYSADDVLRAYAIFGGVPYYLQMCDPGVSLRENVIALLLSEFGTLVDEPNILLQNELREPQVYSSILAAISEGCTTRKEISDRLRTDLSSLGPYFAKLGQLELISANRSLDADERARNQRFTVDDSLIAFWHRFVRPNLTAINSGHGAAVYDTVLARTFSEYMGSAFERICLGFVAEHASELLGAPAQRVGGIWGHADFDIDVAGKLLDDTYFYGECKWTAAPFDMGMVRTLLERSEKTAWGRGKSGKQYLLLSRLGFKPEVVAATEVDASIHLVDPRRMVLGTGPALDDEPTPGRVQPS